MLHGAQTAAVAFDYTCKTPPEQGNAAMIRLVSSVAPGTRDLAQQNADVTAEDSPAPVRLANAVATAAPARTPARPVHLTVTVNDRLVPAQKGRRSGSLIRVPDPGR
jgi:hypothetical protein